jgi:hypothetical protein
VKAIDFGKVFGVAVISQIVAFLNAIYQPFAGTIFVFDDWQPIASRSAVAVGFVVVFVMAVVIIKYRREIRQSTIVKNAVAAGILLGVCATIHFLLTIGFAPTPFFLFIVRDVLWQIVYIAMLVMVGVTIALGCLMLFGTNPPAPTADTSPAPANDGRQRRRKRR